MLGVLLFVKIRRAAQNRSNNNQGITVDRDAFARAAQTLQQQAQALQDLRRASLASFNALRTDWDSAAGRAFFNKFENELLRHIDQYAGKLATRAQALNTVRGMYDPVFQAADAVANAQYE